MIEASCHCGKVNLLINDEIPKTLTSCNCSICSRYGSLMAYFSTDKVIKKYDENSIDKYIWGDKSISFVRCKTCGCFSFWEGMTQETNSKMGFNARLFLDIDINKIKMRYFDGKDTWKYLDGGE